ncbi:hypothetical protein K2Q16_01205 [Patescibacteria group bacterium]|nr:hypothetical protein [Patescibacteria group bacterium]
MTLTPRTKQYFVLALLVAATAVLAALYLLVQIRGQGARLEANSIVINESSAQLEATTRSKRLIDETEEERAMLRRSFFKESSDSLDFLTQLETLAPQFDLELTEIILEEISNPATPGKSEMLFRFGYRGSKSAVFDFTKLLEVLPYHSRLQSVTLESKSDEEWEGRLEVRVTVKTL